MELQVKNIKKSFGNKEVLKGIDLNAVSGKPHGLLGRNGAGKSTTIRIIMDMFKADSGEVLIDGVKAQKSDYRLSYLPEERGLYPKEKIKNQIEYFAQLKGLGKEQIKRNLEYWFEKLEIVEYLNKIPQTLSKGNQQKVQLASCLIQEPDILILDEPFSGLDPVNASFLKDAIMEFKNKNKIILFSSHQMNYIEEICQDISIINDGCIVLNGDLKEIQEDISSNRFTIEGDIDGLDNLLQHEIIDGKKLYKINNIEEQKAVYNLLSQSNSKVKGVIPYRLSLNDIFIKYTQGGI